MKMFGFTIEFYAKTHLLAKCYGNEYVLLINELNVYRDKKRNEKLFSCLGQMMKGRFNLAFEVLFKKQLKAITNRRCHMKDN